MAITNQEKRDLNRLFDRLLRENGFRADALASTNFGDLLGQIGGGSTGDFTFVGGVMNGPAFVQLLPTTPVTLIGDTDVTGTVALDNGTLFGTAGVTILSPGSTSSLGVDDSSVTISNGGAALLTATGGNLALGNSTNGDSLFVEANQVRVTQPLRITVAGVRPAAGAGVRGMIWVEQGGAGVADVVSICLKQANDAYDWFTFNVTDENP